MADLKRSSCTPADSKQPRESVIVNEELSSRLALLVVSGMHRDATSSLAFAPIVYSLL